MKESIRKKLTTAVICVFVIVFAALSVCADEIDRVSFRFDSPSAVNEISDSNAQTLYVAYDSAENALFCNVPEFPSQKSNAAHDNQIIIKDKNLELIDYPYFAAIYKVPECDRYGNEISCYASDMYVYFNQNIKGYTLKSGVLNTTFDEFDNSVRLGYCRWNDPTTDTDPIKGKVFSIRLDFPNGVRHNENVEFYLYEIAFFKTENDVKAYFESVKNTLSSGGTTDYDSWSFDVEFSSKSGEKYKVEKEAVTVTDGESEYTQKVFNVTIPENEDPSEIILSWSFTPDSDYTYNADTQVYINGYSRDLRGAKGTDYTSFLTSGSRLGDAVTLTEAAAKTLSTSISSSYIGTDYNNYKFDYSEFDLTLYSREYVYEVYKIRIVQDIIPTWENVLANCKYTVNGGSWSTDYASYGVDHLQGITCDDKGEYMYMSFTNILVKVDMRTNRVAGVVKGLKVGSLTSGAHIGCLAYHDGMVYASLGYTKEKRWYIGVFDCDKINGEVDYKTEGVMYGLYLPQVTVDALNTLDAGEATFATTSMGHRYGISAIDGITFGKLPGGGYDTDGDGKADITDSKTYMFVSCGPYGNAKRYDNENMVLLVFDLDNMSEKLIPFTEDRLTTDTAENEGYFYKHKMFCYTGNQTYGIQCLETDKDTGDLWLECYGRPEGTEFPLGNRYVIDGSVPLYMDEVEVGQSVTGDAEGFVSKNAAHATAALYTDYEDGDGDGNTDEAEHGWHMSLKCICEKRGMENHTPTVYGATGHECKICIGDKPFDVGMISLGGGYFYGASSGSTIVNGVEYEYGSASLYELNREGAYTFELVADNPAPTPIPGGSDKIDFVFDSLDAVKEISDTSSRGIYLAYDSAENAMRCNIPEFPTQKSNAAYDCQLIINNKSLELIDYPYFAAIYKVPEYDRYGNKVSCYDSNMYVYLNQNISGYTMKSGRLNTAFDETDNTVKMGYFKWNDPETDTDPVKGKVFSIRLDFPNNVRHNENVEFYIYEIAFFKSEEDINTYFESVKDTIGKNGTDELDGWHFELDVTAPDGTVCAVEEGTESKKAGESEYVRKTFNITVPYGTAPCDVVFNWSFTADSEYPYISDTRVYINGHSRDLRGAKGSDHISFLTNGGRLGDAASLTEAAAKNLNDNVSAYVGTDYADYKFDYGEFYLTLYNEEYVHEVYKVTFTQEEPFVYEGAQIRTEGTRGLRFLFSLSESYYNKLTKPQSASDTGEGFGTVVIPSLNADGTPSKNTDGAAVVPAVKLYEEKDGRVYFTVCITEIPQKNYKTDFVCAPYATSSEDTVYGEISESLSVFDVAERIYASEASGEELKKYIYDTILSVADPTAYPIR